MANAGGPGGRVTWKALKSLVFLNGVLTANRTLTGALTMALSDHQFLFLDPGGAGRTLTLPAEKPSKGMFYFINNTADAAEDLTVENDASSTIGVVGQTEYALFHCDGTTWRVMASGTGIGTFNFTEENVLADNDAVYPALEKLDLQWGDLFSTANTEGASLVAIEDAAGNFTGTDVEAAMAEVSTPLTLTVGAEATDVIAVTVAAPQAAVTQYIAQVYEQTMIEALAAAATMAETGAGAEVSTTANASLIFTTDAAGAATLSVTDVAGASGKTFFLEVRPAAASAGVPGGFTAVATLVFD